jgi:MFS superfamily sulfate permease-like transporter
MNQKHKTNIFSNVGNDLAAGLVVFLVALPLCLGIALASGAPLYSGIIAGVVGGIVIGILSKSNLSVSGPAAGLTAIVLVAVTELGAFNIFLCAVILAGVFQIALGLFKAGSIANYIPSNVIEGMLAAIGIIIILKQIPHALGFDKDYEGDFSFFDQTGANTFSAIGQALSFVTPGAIVIALVSLGILLLWERTAALKKMIFLPGPLVVVVASIILNEIFAATGSSLAIQTEHLVNLPVAGNINEFFGQFIRPDFSGFLNPSVWIMGATIAAVASIETLLSIEAIDRLDPHKRYTPTNHELKAQGVGNIISGFLGGLPLTSVIIRSSANVNAKAETKLSVISHGILLLLCAALIPFLLNKIPLAALAAILILTGLKLAKPAAFARMWRNGKYQFVPFIVTIIAIVFTDLLTGVALGLGISVFFLLRENLKVPYFFRQKEYKEGEIIHIHLAQEVSFLNKAAIKMTFEHLPANSYVILDASETSYIDYDVCEVIREFAEVKAPEKGIRLDLVGFKEDYKVANSLTKNHVYVEAITNGKPVYDFNPKKAHDELLGNLLTDKEVLKV